MTVRWGRLDVVVRPYSRRPSPATKWPISTAASTSPSASSRDLPVSARTSPATSSRLPCNASATSRTSLPRSTAVVSAHAGRAPAAAAIASSTSAASERARRQSGAPSAGRSLSTNRPARGTASRPATRLGTSVSSADVVVVQDLAAPAYVAMRLRQLGLGFGSTLFVVYCHGTRQWITDVAQKPRVLSGALAIGVLEQACVELADVVVSPSAYLLAWMEAQGWNLPDDTRVIPYLTRSAATGEP